MFTLFDFSGSLEEAVPVSQIHRGIGGTPRNTHSNDMPDKLDTCVCACVLIKP